MYNSTKILALKSRSKIAAALHNATFGIACYGNYELVDMLANMPKALSDRVRIKKGYARTKALQAVAVNDIWQRQLGKLTGSTYIQENTRKYMLACKLPDMVTLRDSKYSCRQYFICPACLYRKISDFYTYLAGVYRPSHDVYVVKVAMEDASGILPHATMVHQLNRLMRVRYINRDVAQCTVGINCEYGTMMVQPSCILPSPEHLRTSWRASANIVMLMPHGVPPKFNECGITWSATPSNGMKQDVNVYTKVRHIGPGSIESVLSAITTAYAYPAPLLYSALDADHLGQLYAAFTDNNRLICQSRMYGQRTVNKRNKEHSLMKGLDVKNSDEQYICGRSSSEAPSVEHTPGVEERQLPVVHTDYRSLCDVSQIADISG